jgi:hypothetical protein
LILSLIVCLSLFLCACAIFSVGNSRYALRQSGSTIVKLFTCVFSVSYFINFNFAYFAYLREAGLVMHVGEVDWDGRFD